jgi:hypothetical protein
VGEVTARGYIRSGPVVVAATVGIERVVAAVNRRLGLGGATGDPSQYFPAMTPMRWRLAQHTLAASFLVAAVVRVVHFVATMPNPGSSLGVDYRLYMDAALRWQSTGQFYWAYQLAGSYDPLSGPSVLYPPNALLLFAPMSHLPALLWWAIPLGAVAAGIWWLRPATWTWPLLAILVWWPRSQESVLWGNPAMWLVAAETWGLIGSWTGVMVLIKPSVGLFAFVGANRRSWWWTAAALALCSVPFGALWVDWGTAVENSGLNAGYSVAEFAMFVLPLVAWAGRTRRERPWTALRDRAEHATKRAMHRSGLGRGQPNRRTAVVAFVDRVPAGDASAPSSRWPGLS